MTATGFPAAALAADARGVEPLWGPRPSAM